LSIPEGEESACRTIKNNTMIINARLKCLLLKNCNMLRRSF